MPNASAEQQTSTQGQGQQDAAAALAVGGVAATGAGAAPLVAGTTVGALTAAQVAKLSAATISRILDWAHIRWNHLWDPSGPLADEVRKEYPARDPMDVMRLLDGRERSFEAEFRRRMNTRLQMDIPAALKEPDPEVRAERLRQVFARERRFTAMREEAMLNRAMGALEVEQLKVLSPKGAYWKLSEHVKEHTPDCLAMGEKFWPWSVLHKIQPPVHYGCPCYLLGLDEAVHEGLMTHDQVPDEADARRRYGQITDALDADRDISEAEVHALWALAFDRLEESETVARGESAARELLRWSKGFEKGGEFRPHRGGDAGRALRRVLSVPPESPLTQRGRKRGKWQWVAGRYRKIPTDAWTAKVGPRVYHSPPGGTTLYRDGGLASPSMERWNGLKNVPELHSPGFVDTPGGKDRYAKQDEFDKMRAELRDAAHTDKGFPPIAKGDDASAVLALESRTDFRLVDAGPAGGGNSRLTFLNSAGTLIVSTNDHGIVTGTLWEPARERGDRIALNRPARTWKEHQSDALAFADELGVEYGAAVKVPSFSTDPTMGDHAGTHLWTGETKVGVETPKDIERGARARGENRPLTDDEKRGVYSSYWVTGHEISHGVNSIDPWSFTGANADLEEALAEEVGHMLAVQRLAKHGQYDVIAWRAANPDAPCVRGVYLNERFALGKILDEAGVPIVDRPELLRQMKFEMNPDDRVSFLAELEAKHKGTSAVGMNEYIERVFEEAKANGAPDAFAGIVNPSAMRMLGSLQFGKWESGSLNKDQTVLTLPNGSHRAIERRFPLPEEGDLGEWAKANGFLEPDGRLVGITTYPPGWPMTGDSPRYANGNLKSFGSFRPIQNEQLARLALRGWSGMASPGAWIPNENALDGAITELESPHFLADGNVDVIGDGVPVRKFEDGTFGVGVPHGSSDVQGLTVVQNTRDAATVALMRSDLARIYSDTFRGEQREPDAGGSAGKGMLPDPPHSPGWGWFGGDDGLLSKIPGKKDKKSGLKGYSGKPIKPKPPEVIGGKKDTPVDDGTPIPDYNGIELTLGKGAGGSNGAKWATDPAGDEWLVKRYNGDENRIATELVGNRIYALMGANVPAAGKITSNGKVGLTMPRMEGAPIDRIFHTKGPSPLMGEHYMTDALLANWDFAGMTDDNVLWDPNGLPIRVDQGGTLEYRAQGQKKDFGPIPTDVWTMLRKGQGKRASAVTEPEMREQAGAIARTLTPELIDGLMDAAPFTDEAMRERVRENLKARVAWMGAYHDGKVDIPQIPEGESARAEFTKAQKSFDVYPEEQHSLSFYSLGGAQAVQDQLRKGGPREAAPQEVQTAIRALDGLVDATKTKEDLYAYIPLKESPQKHVATGLVGKTVEERGYTHATTVKPDGAMIRVLIPAGSHVADLSQLDGTNFSGDLPELLIERGSRLKVTEHGTQDGRDVFQATLMRPSRGFSGPSGGSWKPSKPKKPGGKPSGQMKLPVSPASPGTGTNPIPLPPGETPLPKGHVRLFHQTKADAAKIRREGLHADPGGRRGVGTVASDRPVEQQRGVWAQKAAQGVDGEWYGWDDEVYGAHKMNTVEFSVPQAEWDKQKGATSDLLPRDVKPSEIMAVHEPWHEAARSEPPQSPGTVPPLTHGGIAVAGPGPTSLVKDHPIVQEQADSFRDGVLAAAAKWPHIAQNLDGIVYLSDPGFEGTGLWDDKTSLSTAFHAPTETGYLIAYNDRPAGPAMVEAHHLPDGYATALKARNPDPTFNAAPDSFGDGIHEAGHQLAAQSVVRGPDDQWYTLEALLQAGSSSHVTMSDKSEATNPFNIPLPAKPGDREDLWKDEVVKSGVGWGVLANAGFNPPDIPKLSQYAASAPGEAFAEMVAGYLHPDGSWKESDPWNGGIRRRFEDFLASLKPLPAGEQGAKIAARRPPAPSPLGRDIVTLPA